MVTCGYKQDAVASQLLGVPSFIGRDSAKSSGFDPRHCYPATSTEVERTQHFRKLGAAVRLISAYDFECTILRPRNFVKSGFRAFEELLQHGEVLLCGVGEAGDGVL